MLLPLGGRQRVEQLGARHVVDVEVDARRARAAAAPRATKAMATALSCSTSDAVGLAPLGRAQPVDAGRAAVAGASPSAARSGTVSLGRVTNGAISAGRRASAAVTSGHSSCGSHGVSVMAVPGGKFSLRSCSACGSACVGPSSPVFSPACAHDQDHRPVGAALGGHRAPGCRWRAGARRCARAGRGRRAYDDATPMWWPNGAEARSSTPAMASSQMPPTASRRALGVGVRRGRSRPGSPRRPC